MPVTGKRALRTTDFRGRAGAILDVAKWPLDVQRRRDPGHRPRRGRARHNGGEAPIDKERFVNARAEDYWTLRERFEQGEVDTDPDDDKLADQLGSIKWGHRLPRPDQDRESKDDMRKRGLPSPDSADAMAIAFAGRANAAPMNVESHSGESITGDLMSRRGDTPV